MLLIYPNGRVVASSRLGGVAETVVGTILIGALLNGLVVTNVNPCYSAGDH
jgi:ribose/xylose/arabinose/galactoside ABC-type transport system permease subunit